MDRAIEHLLFTFFRGFDERDWDTMAECLCPVLFIDYSSFRGDPPGDVSAEEFVGKRRKALSSLLMQHNLTNLRVTATEGGATVACNYQIYRFTDPAISAHDSYFHSFGVYQFTIASTPGGLRIAAITQTLLRNVGDPSIHSGAAQVKPPTLP